MKNTFAANVFAANTFKSGTWTGVGVTVVTVGAFAAQWLPMAPIVWKRAAHQVDTKIWMEGLCITEGAQGIVVSSTRTISAQIIQDTDAVVYVFDETEEG